MPDFHFVCRFECHNPLFFALGMLKIAWLPGGFAPRPPSEPREWGPGLHAIRALALCLPAPQIGISWSIQVFNPPPPSI